MRILVVGAGAVGGYFGGRLLQAGRDVTFLVRPRRAAELAKDGLIIRSPLGDFHRPSPPTVSQEELAEPFDLVLLSCKAYDLDGAMDSFAKAVGENTAILPLLNGLRHLDALAGRFGPKPLLGGQCVISATLGGDGAIVHFNEMHALSFGELDGSRSKRIETIASELVSCRLRRSSQRPDPPGDVGEVGVHCLGGRHNLPDAVVGRRLRRRRRLGPRRRTPGRMRGHRGRAGISAARPAIERARAVLTAAGSPLKASMLRDIEGGKPVEGDQILGDLLRRAANPDERSLLRIATLHVRAYEAERRAGETAER